MATFQETGLDPRLVRALAKRGFQKPTSVQQAVIPCTLEGKDIVARARTGSGKTLAYLLPALHRLLATMGSQEDTTAAQQSAGLSQSFQAMVLVPTRELCEQVKSEAQEVAQHCGIDILVTALTAANGPALKRAVAAAGHLVVSTPGKIASAIKEGALQPSALEQRLQTLILDEADLLLSYGYEADLQLLAPLVPRSCQVLLMSATSSSEVEQLQKLVLHNPITLNLLSEGAANGVQGNGDVSLASGSGVSSTITHWSYECSKDDKLLVVMAILKLGLVRKKVLVFVNSIDQGYKLKLFLETFGINAALLNAEMPLNSRSHCLAAFNRGMFDYLIATDDVHAVAHDTGQPQSKKRKRGDAGQHNKRKNGPSKDEEFGVTRGIDFKGVRTIINFDPPSSVQGYVHRVGRTGRAGEEGGALSLFTPDDMLIQSEVKGMLDAQTSHTNGANTDHVEGDGIVSGSDSEDEEDTGKQKQQGMQPFARLSKAQVDALRYRGEDVARSITKKAIKDARAAELKQELLNSEKLKDYFEEHVAEKKLLRHDKTLHKTANAPHLKHLPAYLKDPTSIANKTATGNAAPAMLDARKRHKLPKPAESHLTGVGGATANTLSRDGASEDPLKSVKGFVRAPKRGGHHDEEMTEMEKRAMAAGLKEAKKRAKTEGKAFIPKRNVRKFKRHR